MIARLRVTSIWAHRGAILWPVLNLVDLAESLVAREIGCGELNPFIPLGSPLLARLLQRFASCRGFDLFRPNKEAPAYRVAQHWYDSGSSVECAGHLNE